MFIITWLDPTLDQGFPPVPLIALILDASTGEARFQFIHGMENTQSGDQAFPDTAGRLLGYAIDGQNLFDDTPDITADNAYSVKLNSVASVPEPATWLAMLVGFGAIGLTFRRGRRARSRPDSEAYARFTPTLSRAFSRAFTPFATPASATCTLAKRTDSGFTGAPFLSTS